MKERPTCHSERRCGPGLSDAAPEPPPPGSCVPPAETPPALWTDGFAPPSEPAMPPPAKVSHNDTLNSTTRLQGSSTGGL